MFIILVDIGYDGSVDFDTIVVTSKSFNERVAKIVRVLGDG